MSQGNKLDPILEGAEPLQEGGGVQGPSHHAAEQHRPSLHHNKERSAVSVGSGVGPGPGIIDLADQGEAEAPTAHLIGRGDISSTLASIEEMLRQEKQFLESSKEHDLYHLIFEGIDTLDLKPTPPPATREVPAKSVNVKHRTCALRNSRHSSALEHVLGETMSGINTIACSAALITLIPFMPAETPG